MNNAIKIALAILFLLCLADMPYGYFQFVRFAGMLGFTLLAYFAYTDKQNTSVIIYIGLALLFQPFYKIALGRTLWNIVDVIIAIALIASIFIKLPQEKR